MYVGIDIGGTKTLALGVRDPEDFSEPLRISTPQGVEEGIEAFSGLIRDAAAGASVEGIGVSIGGPMDWEKGLCSFLHLPQWTDVPFRDALQERFACPVNIEVDTDAAVLAEARLGGASGRRLLYVTVSTGIGAGFLVNGEIYRGGNAIHPEFGHQIVPSSERFSEVRCPCGAKNCVESLISGRSIEKHFGKPAKELLDSEWAEVAMILASALRNAAILYAPDHISLGGGVCVNAPELFLTVIRKSLEENVSIIPSPTVSLSELGYETCLRGALLLAAQG